MVDPPRRWRARIVRTTGWTLVAGAVAGLAAAPLGALLGVARADGWSSLLASVDARATQALLNTLLVGLLVTATAVAGGTAAALVTERWATRGRRWLRLGLLIPFLTPPFVAAVGWVRAYGPAGLTDQALGIGWSGLFGAAGITVVLAVHALPLAYLVVAAGLATRAEPDLERAARVSGGSASRVLRSITLPLLRPALVTGAVLVFVTSVNAFGVPAVLGIPAAFGTVTTRIYQDLAFAADEASFSRVIALACVLVVLAMSATGVAALAGRRATVRTGGAVGSDLPTPGRSRLPACLLGGYLLLTTLVPLIALVLTAMTRAAGLPPVPANLTLDNFGRAVDGRTAAALTNSLLLAVVAATFAVLLGALVVILARRRGSAVVPAIATVTFAVPGSTLAVAILLAYGGWLRDTLLLILVAYLAKLWVLGLRPLASSADRLPPELVFAARASGAGPVSAFVTVILPLFRPVAAAAWLLVFIFALHELTMSSLLYGPGSTTLAVVVLNLQQLGDPTVTAALAVLLTVLVLGAALPVLLFRRSMLDGLRGSGA